MKPRKPKKPIQLELPFVTPEFLKHSAEAAAKAKKKRISMLLRLVVARFEKKPTLPKTEKPWLN
jgi:hypothetical protein